MRRPNDRDVGGLADPQNFFLNFGKALIAAFDGQIASRNHDSDRTRAHGRKNQLERVLERFARFNLQDQPRMPAIHPFEMIEKLANVALGAHEG